MGYDALDLALMEAWSRHLTANPDGDGVKVFSKMYRRPLRSWCLALRADDRRLRMQCVSYRRGVLEDSDWIEVMVFKPTLEALCSRVYIAWPGVSIGEAAGRFGVNPTTVRRWVGRGLLEMERDENRADAKRRKVRVWTRRGVDPTGEVYEGPWGSLTRDLVRKVGEDWEQILVLRVKKLGPKSQVKQWRCAGCGRWVSKLYMPVAMSWMGEVLGWGDGDGATIVSRLNAGGMSLGRFLCRGCHGVVYESSELTSRPAAGRRVDVMDRFVKRYSGGVLRGRDV